MISLHLINSFFIKIHVTFFSLLQLFFYTYMAPKEKKSHIRNFIIARFSK